MSEEIKYKDDNIIYMTLPKERYDELVKLVESARIVFESPPDIIWDEAKDWMVQYHDWKGK